MLHSKKRTKIRVSASQMFILKKQHQILRLKKQTQMRVSVSQMLRSCDELVWEKMSVANFWNKRKWESQLVRWTFGFACSRFTVKWDYTVKWEMKHFCLLVRTEMGSHFIEYVL